jgi:ubiquinone/menaquinone biosynthesis C-methylase UbiE
MAVRSDVRNHWPDAKCAKAFWSQQELRPYQKLLTDTVDLAAPADGELWLDIGCGGGPLTKAIWEKTRGRVGGVVGLDCAAVNEQPYRKLQQTLTPTPGEQIRFIRHNFSEGLHIFPDDAFDHAISGLSITYAESYSEARGGWTTDAYETVLAETRRVIRPGGRFVFSVNVPEPSWFRVGFLSLGGIFGTRRPLRFLKRALRMMEYGSWLKREARTGRFHYLPQEAITKKLQAAGFVNIDHKLSYANQAYIFRAHKPNAA